MSSLREMTRQDATAAGPVVAVDTDDIVAPDRFGWWNDMVGHEVMPVAIQSPHANRFRGQVEAVGFPRSQVAAFDFSPLTARRSPAHIRRRDPEDYFLVLVRQSAIRLEQARNVVCLSSGDMALFSSSQPLTCDFLDRGGLVCLTLLRIPRALLPLADHRADRMLAERLPNKSGSGALLGTYLTSLPAAARGSGPVELARLGAIGVDLAGSLLAARYRDQDSLPAETRRTALLVRISAFIDHQLADPALDPAAIAAHHHISVRTLHQFQGEPESVAATIRRRRLERCRADLTEPHLRHRTIGDTALRWGFRHPADFSRAFRRAYGVSPGEVRAALR
ncbi:helix-turn-helix domain-containing protein [Streptomyces sp. NBC_00124]|uniref:AraC-like ligand-binding domain-containing protein n=1 Tax=Streptomyces sp. NBC_00124 TaxID=2975662 RepID=UPI002252B35A|nr:helix-turn-helix domain-containing protein [Streptomyces sp. NBC_00124]MCX5358172.1 helix-turn-helix domain-containing protein [Streptomyces sp. NBC_00124]